MICENCKKDDPTQEVQMVPQPSWDILSKAVYKCPVCGSVKIVKMGKLNIGHMTSTREG